MIRELLDEEIRKNFELLQSMDMKDPNRGTVIANVKTLFETRVDQQKADSETKDREKRREMDKENSELERAIKQKELNGQKYDRLIKIGTSLAQIGVPLGFYWFWLNRGFAFEKNGCYTSKTFLNLVNKFNPPRI